jgi:hypothetical protein
MKDEMKDEMKGEGKHGDAVVNNTECARANEECVLAVMLTVPIMSCRRMCRLCLELCAVGTNSRGGWGGGGDDGFVAVAGVEEM